MALIKTKRPALRRLVDEEGEASWLELFFDLIYVAALIQLGNQLADDITWDGATFDIDIRTIELAPMSTTAEL
jgi:low temperature requirement protein LtrA